MKSTPLILISSLLLLHHITTPSNAVPFTCNSSATATCQSLAGYIPSVATNLSSIQSLFQVPSYLSLLGPNNLPLSTPSSYTFPANSTVLVPFPCRCSNGTGTSDHVPVYTVKTTDTGLDAIARYTFDQFVTYQEIVSANGIKNANVIHPGDKYWIPLPCSCDPVMGQKVVHLGHVVAAGSSVAEIATEFGTTQEVLLKLNGMTDPSKLLAGQILDVPLRACSSSIKSSSLDYDLLLPNNSYALTAENCIQCSCSAPNYQLSCQPIQGLSKSKCPMPKCGSNLFLGNSTSDGCNLTTCAYEGYTNTTGLTILNGLINQSTCGNGPAPSPNGGSSPPGSPPSGSSAGRLKMQGHHLELMFVLQIVFICLSLLA